LRTFASAIFAVFSAACIVGDFECRCRRRWK
jgi:hypothetical protein